jgi:hypothetical protein
MSKDIDELSTHYDDEGSSFADANGGSDAQRKVDGGQSAANSSRFTTTFLVMLGLSCVLVGIGAGIGAGYGIFNKEETPIVFQPEDMPEQWLVIVNSDNGTLSVSPDGVMRIDMNYLREQAPAFTNIPHRIATLTKMDTAFDFIEEGIERDQGGLIESRIARRALSLCRSRSPARRALSLAPRAPCDPRALISFSRCQCDSIVLHSPRQCHTYHPTRVRSEAECDGGRLGLAFGDHHAR